MWVIIIILIALGLFVPLLRMFISKDENAPTQPQPQDCGSCSSCDGRSGKCLQDRIIEQAATEPEYFDDEELDEYKGKSSDSYTDEEAERFAEVMYTMRREEVPDWLASLTLRGVNLPDQLKDEAIMLVDD